MHKACVLVGLVFNLLDFVLYIANNNNYIVFLNELFLSITQSSKHRN